MGWDSSASITEKLNKQTKKSTKVDVAQAFNLSTRETEAGRSLLSLMQLYLHSKFQANHGYRVKPGLKTKHNRTNALNQPHKSKDTYSTSVVNTVTAYLGLSTSQVHLIFMFHNTK